MLMFLASCTEKESRNTPLKVDHPQMENPSSTPAQQDIARNNLTQNAPSKPAQPFEYKGLRLGMGEDATLRAFRAMEEKEYEEHSGLYEGCGPNPAPDDECGRRDIPL
jgi:hypothetical protein